MQDESDAVHSRLSSHRHFDVYEVAVMGEGLKLAPVGQHTTFTVQATNVEASDVTCKISGESAK